MQVRIKRLVKRLPLTPQLATIHYHWKTEVALSPLSRLRMGLYYAVPALAPREARFRLTSGAHTVLRWRSTDRYVFTQIFVLRQYALPAAAIGPIRLVIDAGAYTGLSSLFFADAYPDACIVALEPDPENFELLCRNVAGCRNIVPIHAALWSETSTLSLPRPDPYNEWGGRVGAAELGQPRVRALTVSDLVKTYGDVDVLKLDIEGAERDVFLHASDWISQVRVIAVELHHDIHPDVGDVFTRATRQFAQRIVRGELTVAIR